MSWKDVLKMHCGTERMETDEDEEEFEKTLVGNHNERMNKRELKDGNITISHDECKDMERKILAEVKKEGGALGMKNLKGIASPKKLKMVLDDMKKRGTIHEHTNGDFYTHKPKR
jgi:hypothetical protein|tara:strand:- start:195 stop:539 length:345 start_codon:yes stop_codon:yes gene_type:complete